MLQPVLRPLLRSLLRSPLAPAPGNAGGGANVLDFATLTPAALASRFGWTRTGAGTMVNASGLVIAGPQDGATFLMRSPDYSFGTPGLLLEGARTNIAARSNNLDDSSRWSTASIAVSSGYPSPFGTTSGFLVYPTSSGGGRRFNNGLSGSAGIYCWSIYAKFSGIPWLYVFKGDGSAVAAWFNVQTGAVSNVASGFTAYTRDEGNGWYRLVLITPSQTPIYLGYIGLASGPGSESVTANGTDGILLAQLDVVLGNYPSSPIPNAGTGTVLRAADYPQVISGAELTALIGDGTDFVLCLRYSLRELGPIGLIAELAGAADRATVNGVIALDAARCVFYGVGFSAQGDLAAASVVGQNKIAIAYAANNMRISINGGAVAKDLSGAIGGNLGRLSLGHQTGSSNQHRDMVLHEIQGRPGQGSTISDAALQALSTLPAVAALMLGGAALMLGGVPLTLA